MLDSGISSGDIERAVIIGATRKVLLPGVGKTRFDLMLFAQTIDFFRCQEGYDVLQTDILSLVARAIQFKILEEQKHLLEMVRGQAVIHRIQRMGKHVNDPLPLQVTRQVEYVFPHLLNVLVLRFVDVICKDVDFASVFGKVCGDFFADKSIWEMCDCQ